MKELNSYKEEIFRRSEEKKRQIRRNRRIALGVVIPLCLCCVLTAAVFPYLPLGGKDFAPSMEAVCDNAMFDENGVQERPMETFLLADPLDAARVLEILEQTDPEYTVKKDQLDRENTLADREDPDQYRLILQCSDGSTVHYQIQGQKAYCETTGETIFLTDAQVSSLYALLMQATEKP